MGKALFLFSFGCVFYLPCLGALRVVVGCSRWWVLFSWLVVPLLREVVTVVVVFFQLFQAYQLPRVLFA